MTQVARAHRRLIVRYRSTEHPKNWIQRRRLDA